MRKREGSDEHVTTQNTLNAMIGETPRCASCGHNRADGYHNEAYEGICSEPDCYCDGPLFAPVETETVRDEETATANATNARLAFTAYVRAGFSEKQAMRLLVAVIESGAW